MERKGLFARILGEDVKVNSKNSLKKHKKKEIIDQLALRKTMEKEKAIDQKVSEEELKNEREIPKKEMEIARKFTKEELEEFRKNLKKEIEIEKDLTQEQLLKSKNIQEHEKEIAQRISKKQFEDLKKTLTKELEEDSKEKKNNKSEEKVATLTKKDQEKMIREKEMEIEKKIAEEEIIKQIEKDENLKKQLQDCAKDISKMKEEISKIVMGHDEALNGIIRGFLANGHVLIEGVPGIAKTLLIRTIAKVSGCEFSRIQFTVDLLPTDITGVTTYNEKTNEFTTVKGPIFSNFIIADEINRSPPKAQSALLEAMQEKQVTIGKTTHKLPVPFFVMANNNPLESSGTYPLPEAQVDRFLFKLNMGYTSLEDEEKVIDTNITIHKFSKYDIQSIISPSKILKMQEITKDILASPKIKQYIVRIVDATRNPKQYGITKGKYIEWGCSPRASIGLTIAAKADAVIEGKPYITPQNVKNVAKDVLRHRLILNYRGQAENIKSDDIVEEILRKVPLP